MIIKSVYLQITFTIEVIIVKLITSNWQILFQNNPIYTRFTKDRLKRSALILDHWLKFYSFKA